MYLGKSGVASDLLEVDVELGLRTLHVDPGVGHDLSYRYPLLLLDQNLQNEVGHLRTEVSGIEH